MEPSHYRYIINARWLRWSFWPSWDSRVAKGSTTIAHSYESIFDVGEGREAMRLVGGSGSFEARSGPPTLIILWYKVNLFEVYYHSISIIIYVNLVKVDEG